MIWVLVVTLVLLAGAEDSLPNRKGTCGPSSKVTYSETVLPSEEIDDYHVSFVSDNNQIIFIRTTDGHIYRSGDEGITWIKQTVPSIMPHIDDSQSRITRMTSAEVANTVTAYFLGGNGKLWVTHDNGVTYKYYDNVPSNVRALEVHPSNPGLVLARRVVSGTSTTAVELWLGDTTGSEMKWTKLIDNVPYFAPFRPWSSNAKRDANDIRIFTMRYSEGNQNNYASELIVSNDWFKTHKTLPVHNVSYWYHLDPDKFVVITCSDTVTCSSKRMQISEDGGQTFSTAVFPDYRTESRDHGNFFVYELTDDAIWARVEKCRVGTNICWGDMYHSDAGDKDFTLSMPYQAH